MRILKHISKAAPLALSGAFFFSLLPSEAAYGYKRASDSRDNVKLKLYPSKSGTVEIYGQGGLILNQSYVTSFVMGGGIHYFTSKDWGIGFDYAISNNSDKEERTCIESFFNDTKQDLENVCGPPELLEGKEPSNYGPAYVPIREIQNIMTFNMVWTPVYGKQLFLYSFMSHFDLYIEMGAGFASSLFYPQRDELRNGNAPRGAFPKDGSTPDPAIGAGPDETDSYGIDGRPDPASESHALINLGLGHKLHFAGMMHAKLFVRNMTLLGTESGFENLFVLYGGLGMRF